MFRLSERNGVEISFKTVDEVRAAYEFTLVPKLRLGTLFEKLCFPVNIAWGLQQHLVWFREAELPGVCAQAELGY